MDHYCSYANENFNCVYFLLDLMCIPFYRRIRIDILREGSTTKAQQCKNKPSKYGREDYYVLIVRTNDYYPDSNCDEY